MASRWAKGGLVWRRVRGDLLTWWFADMVESRATFYGGFEATR
jgi:hypothetical protein